MEERSRPSPASTVTAHREGGLVDVGTRDRTHGASPNLEAPSSPAPASGAPPWTFLSNHAHVLICIAQDPDSRMRDLAFKVGITERAVQRIVTELEDAGYLARRREGRRNRYQLSASQPLRHPIERHCATDSLLDLVLGPDWRRD